MPPCVPERRVETELQGSRYPFFRGKEGCFLAVSWYDDASGFGTASISTVVDWRSSMTSSVAFRTG